MSGCGNHQCQCRLENDSAFGRGRGAKVSTRSCGHQSAGTSRVRQERISPRPLPVAGCIRLWLLYPIVARLQPHEQQFLCQKKGVYWPKLSRSDMSGARVCERAAGKDAAKPLRRDRLSAMNGPQQCTGNGGVRVCISAVHHRLHYAFHQGRGVQKLIEGILQGNQPPSLVPLVVLGWPLCRLSKRFGSRCCHKRSLGLIQSCLVTCLGRTSFGDRCGNRSNEDGTGIQASGVGMS